MLRSQVSALGTSIDPIFLGYKEVFAANNERGAEAGESSMNSASKAQDTENTGEGVMCESQENKYRGGG
jgi:hypothetical protein